MKFAITILVFATALSRLQAQQSDPDTSEKNRRLFTADTVGGNGRICLTCHSFETGTVSPEDAEERYRKNPLDPLFLFDGSDDGQGHGVTRMLKDATVLIEIPLPPNVSLADDQRAKSVTLRQGIPTTRNAPALDPVLMLDGRDPSLLTQALHAIQAHFQTTVLATVPDLIGISQFELTEPLYSSPTIRAYAHGGPAPVLPQGRMVSEKRGRLFFVVTHAHETRRDVTRFTNGLRVNRALIFPASFSSAAPSRPEPPVPPIEVTRDALTSSISVSVLPGLALMSLAIGSRPGHALAVAVAPATPEPVLYVRLFDEVNLATDTRDRFMGDAEDDLRAAGVRSIWLSCPVKPFPDIPPGLHGRSPWSRRVGSHPGAQNVRERELALGYSVAGPNGGTYSTICYPTVVRAAQIAQVPVSRLLALATLHEIGHLLLGANAHWPQGIMNPFWEQGRIDEMTKHGPLFTRAQSKLLRARVVARAAAATRNQ